MIINMNGAYEPPPNITYVPTGGTEKTVAASFSATKFSTNKEFTTASLGFMPTQLYGYCRFPSSSTFGDIMHCGDYSGFAYGMNKQGSAVNKSSHFTWTSASVKYMPYDDANWGGTVWYTLAGY